MKLVLEPDPRYRYAVDGKAARVVKPGFDYSPEKHITCADQAVPFKVRKIAKDMQANPSFVDLTGVRFGRFVVYGLAANHQARWACRCDCGRYALRSAKAIKNPSNDLDRCDHCRHLAFLKREEEWRQTGRDGRWRK